MNNTENSNANQITSPHHKDQILDTFVDKRQYFNQELVIQNPDQIDPKFEDSNESNKSHPGSSQRRQFENKINQQLKIITEVKETEKEQMIDYKNISSNLQNYKRYLRTKTNQKISKFYFFKQIFTKDQKSGLNQIWKLGALRIFYYLTRLVILIKLGSDQYKFKLFTPKLFKLLSDPTAEYSYYFINEHLRAKPNKFQRIYKYLFRISSKFFNPHHLFGLKLSVISPFSKYKIAFNFILLILTIINTFYVPIKLSFDLKSQMTYEIEFFVDTLPSIVYILDIFVNFNTAYYSRGLLRKKRKDIIKYYLKGDFMLDLIVVIPFFISENIFPYIDFLLLFRVARLQKIFASIEEITSIREKLPTAIDLGKLIYFLILVNHMSACLWHYVGSLEENLNWIKHYELDDSKWFQRYIFSYYWSTITTLTVGYGDIVPQNTSEQIFVIIITLITSIVFGYTLSRIGQIFSQIQQENDEFKNKMALINSYIKKHKLTKELQLKVRKYFEYYFQSQKSKEEECANYIEELTQDLKYEVKNEIFGKAIQKCDLLTLNFSHKFQNDLCQYMKIKKYIPGEEIISQNKTVKSLIIIIKGRVQISLSNQKSKQFFLLLYSIDLGINQNEILGLKNFLMQSRNEYTACAKSFTEIAYISYDDFTHCLKKHRKDYEKFFVVKENLVFNPYYKKIQEICPICSFSHPMAKCSFLFFQPKQSTIVSQHKNKKEFQQRKQWQRSFLKYFVIMIQ